MKIFPHAEFRADVPDDAVEKGDDIVVFPGRGLAEIIAGMLTRLGYDVSPPDHAHEHGWELDARRGGRRVWLQVTQLPGKAKPRPADAILMTEERPTLLQRVLGRKESIHAELLSGLHQEMQAEPRFQEITWWPDHHFQGVSAREPVGTN